METNGHRRDFPLPADGTDPAGFVHSLREVKVWAGNPSLAELHRRTGIAGSTLFDALRPQRRLPALEIVRAVVRACGADRDEVHCWEKAWRALSDRPAAGPEVPVAAAEQPGWLPRQLPPDVAGFTGRRSALDTLRRTPAAAPATVITGTAGVGKSALAVHWAHHLAARYPDGQLYLDLRGYSGDPAVTAAGALPLLLQSLGVAVERIPADLTLQTGLYRSVLAERRVLVVLDNAADAAHVRPLLPGGTGCHALVTSRDALTGLVVREGVAHVALDVLDPPESVELLTTQIGRARAEADPAAVRELAELCAHLPLALRIAAANLAVRPGRSVAAAVAELRDGERLGRLRVVGDPESAVAAAFETSYRALPAESRRLFRLLGLIPGPEAGREAAAVLLGRSADDPVPELDELLAAHLVAEPAPDRFRSHDLLALYARRHAAAEPGTVRGPARHRLFSWYLLSAGAAIMAIFPDRKITEWGEVAAVGPPHRFAGPAEARGWLETELPNLTAAAASAADDGPASFAWNIVKCLASFLYTRGDTRTLLTVARSGRRAAEGVDHAEGRGHVHMALAMAGISQGNLAAAAGEFSAAHEQFLRGGSSTRNVHAAAGALADLHIRSGDIARAVHVLIERLANATPSQSDKFQWANLATACRIQGEHAEAFRHAAACRRLAADAGVLSLIAFADITTARVHLDRGDTAAAEPLLLAAYALAGEVGSEIDVYDALTGLVLVAARTGRHAEAAARSAELELLLERGVTSGSGDDWAHAAMMEAHLAAGQPARAVAVGAPALDRHDRIGHRLTAMRLRVLLGQARLALGDSAAARALGEAALPYAIEQELPDRRPIEALLAATETRS